MFGREAELSRDLACVWEGKSRGIWCEAARWTRSDHRLRVSAVDLQRAVRRTGATLLSLNTTLFIR